MDKGFAFAELRENDAGAFAHQRSELRFLQDLEDRAQRQMLGLIYRLRLDVGSGHAVLPNFFGGKLPARHLQAAQFGAKVVDVAAGVNQSAERHVTANSRKTIKISDFHGMLLPRERDSVMKSLSAGSKLILSAQTRRVKQLPYSWVRDFKPRDVPPSNLQTRH